MRSIYYILSILCLSAFSSKATAQQAELSLADSVICNGDLATFSSSSTGINSFYWNFGDNPTAGFVRTSTGQTSHRYYSAGTFIVTLVVVDNMGARDTTAKTIRVKDQPNASFDLSKYPNAQGVFCVGTHFGINRWSNFSGFDSLHWDFGDGFTSNLKYPEHTFTTTGTYKVKLKVYGFCGMDSSEREVQIVDDARGVPELNTYLNNNPVCLGDEVGIQVSTYEATINSFICHTGDGNSTPLDDFRYTYAKKGSYKVMAIGTNTCGSDTSYADVTVSEEIDMSPTLNTEMQICAQRPTRIGIGTYGGPYDTAFVDFGDGDTAIRTGVYSNLMHNYADTGNYTITVIYTYLSCSSPDTMTKVIRVDSTMRIFPFYLRASASQVCPNQEFNVYGPSLGPGDTLILHFGDGTMKKYADTRPTIIHSYPNTGTYMMKAYRKTVCGKHIQLDSSSYTMTVRGDIQTGIGISANYSSKEDFSCLGDSVTLRVGPLNGMGTIKDPKIILHDGTVIMGMSHKLVYPKNGKYLVMATGLNSCDLPVAGAFTVEIIDRMMNPTISGYHYPRTQCVNQEFFFDVFTDNTTSLHWDFGDGTTMSGQDGPHIMHAYNKAGTYDVTITATNGCGTTVAKRKAYVEAGPAVDFTLSKANINEGDTLHLTNETMDETGHYWFFNFNPKDSTSEDNPSRVYPQEGRFAISMFAIDEFSCWDTLTKFVNVGQINIREVKKGVNLLAYPNPSTGTITVKTLLQDGGTVSIIDLQGRTMHEVELPQGINNKELNISHLPKGIYFLQLQSNGLIYSEKFVLIHP